MDAAHARPGSTTPAWVYFLVLTSFAVSTGVTDLHIRAFPARAYAEFIPAVVQGTADAPERYRVLVPFQVHGLAAVTGWSMAAAWHLSRFLWILAAYLVFFAYLRTWFRANVALVGTAIVAATLPLTFTNSWAHPDHMAELALFTAGCWAIARNADWWFLALLVVSSLNRETTVFLVCVYAAVSWNRPHGWLKTAGFAGVWGVIYVGLRVVRGFAVYDLWQVRRNVAFLQLLPPNYDPYYRAYAYFVIVLFAPLLLLGLRGLRDKPIFVRRALLVVPLFALVCFTISSIIETRIFTPLYPIVMPAVMFSLAPADIQE